MADMWRVHPGGLIHFENASLYEAARHRILHSRRLQGYLNIILGDGYADDARHLKWAATGKVAELESWAKRIRLNPQEPRP
ncbi:MAG: hypothetical protein FJ284_12400 [Planctomycetes bacterium]|nr:hypothetical protein [Planctomycetota bacterium]